MSSALAAMAMLMTGVGCGANDRATIPGSVDEPPDDGEGGEIDISTPEALEGVDFAATSGMVLAQVGHPEDMTNNPAMSHYVDIAGMLQLTGVGNVDNGKISLSQLDDSDAETAVAVKIVRSYDNATAWILPKALLAPGTRHKLHVTVGDATGTQEFRTQIDVGDIEAGNGAFMTGDASAALQLTPSAALHPTAEGVGQEFLADLGLLLAAGDVILEDTGAKQGNLDLAGFLSDDVDMDGDPDADLVAGTLRFTGQAHGHYVRLEATVDGTVVMTVTGRLRSFESGWRFMGGAAMVHAPCAVFPSDAGQAACDGDDLVVVAPLKGETVYLSDLHVADKAMLSGEGEARTAVVELTKPRWVSGKDITADDIDLSSGVRAQLLTGAEVAVDSMDVGTDLVAGVECNDEGCFLHRVGVVIGDAELPAGVVTLKVTIGLRSAEVGVEVEGDAE